VEKRLIRGENRVVRKEKEEKTMKRGVYPVRRAEGPTSNRLRVKGHIGGQTYGGIWSGACPGNGSSFGPAEVRER